LKKNKISWRAHLKDIVENFQRLFFKSNLKKLKLTHEDSPLVSLFNWRRFRRSFALYSTHLGLGLLTVLVLGSSITAIARERASDQETFTVISASAVTEEENDVESLALVDNEYTVKSTPIDTVISKKNRKDVVVYTVQPGETVSSLAQDFGLSEATIRFANGLSSNALKNGQKLIITPKDGIIYTVGLGDNLSSIAQNYSATVNHIRKYNKLSEDSRIFAGQKLFLPDATIPTVTSRSSAGYGYIPPVNPNAQGQFAWPTSTARHTLSQSFGRTNYSAWHTGIDLTRVNGHGIFASASGTVKTSWMRGYGNIIIINHGNGYETYYAHLKEFKVSNGQRINQGDLIGIMGSTGWSTGVHLHFEIRYNGSPLNPLNYLP